MKKAVLVTGAAGYIGRHVVAQLLAEGYTIVETDIRPAWELFKGQEPLMKKRQLMSYCGRDIRSFVDMYRIFNRHKFKAIIHLAALTDVKEGELSMREYYNTNTIGTLNLVDLANKYDVKNFVFATSAATEGKSVYGATKHAAEILISKHFKGVNTQLRFYNVAGVDLVLGRPHPYAKGAISKIVEAAVFEKKFVVDGDGSQVRDYVHVKDVARACVKALKEKHARSYEIGTGVPTDLNTVMDLVETFTKSKVSRKFDKKSSPGIKYSLAKRSLIDQAFFAPEHELTSIIRSEITWQRRVKSVPGRKK